MIKLFVLISMLSLTISIATSENPIDTSSLNYHLQSLSQKFIQSFKDQYQIQGSFNLVAISENPGQFLMLLGKMYLYGLIQEKGRFGLAYFYLTIAAQKYQNAEAYYYLAVMEYHRITPDQTVLANLQKHLKDHERLVPLAKYLNISHSYKVEQDLYFSSLLGHHGASVVMANLLKEGIGMSPNCSSALGYYLSAIRNTYVDDYHYRSIYAREGNYEKELYSKRRIDFSGFGDEDNAQLIEDSGYLDQQMVQATLTMADNYFIGRRGYIQNFTRAFELYQKLANSGHRSGTSMLGLLYFKGQGVQKDRKKAKQLFQKSKDESVSSYMLLAMKYFGLDGPDGKALALQKMRTMIKNRNQKRIPQVFKNLLGAVIVKGELPEVSIDEGYILLEESALYGNNQARIIMALFFMDASTNLNYDCARSAAYLQKEGIEHPFFMDKINRAQIALKRQLVSFALLKQMQLLLAGDEDSFINVLYIIDAYPQSIEILKDSFSLTAIMQNPIYAQLMKNQIVPDISTFYLKRFSLHSHSFFTHTNLPQFFQGSDEISKQYRDYLRMKTIKVGSRVTKFSILKFFQYKLELKSNNLESKSDSRIRDLLNSIAADSKDKPHVLQARYLLGKIYHEDIAMKKTPRNYADKYKAIKQYARAAKSEFFGNIIYQIEEHKLEKEGKVRYPEEMDLRIVNDLLAYTFVLSIVIFVLYYLRSRRLDELHQIQVAKAKEKKQREQAQREDLERIKRMEELMNFKFQKQKEQQQIPEDKMESELKQQRQPTQNNEKLEKKDSGVRIGSDFQ